MRVSYLGSIEIPVFSPCLRQRGFEMGHPDEIV